MDKELNDLLFAVSQKLLEIQSLCSDNPVLDNLPALSGVKALQEEVSDKWRELMRSQV